MAENERDIVFSESVKAGKRIYYFDVKETRSGERFLTITESKKIVEGDMMNPQYSFQKHKIFLYKEDYEKFTNALDKTIQVAKGADPEIFADEEQPEDAAETAESDAAEKGDSVSFDVEF